MRTRSRPKARQLTLTEAEDWQLEQRAQAAGYRPMTFVRHMALTGTVPPRPAPTDELLQGLGAIREELRELRRTYGPKRLTKKGREELAVMLRKVHQTIMEL